MIRGRDNKKFDGEEGWVLADKDARQGQGGQGSLISRAPLHFSSRAWGRPMGSDSFLIRPAHAVMAFRAFVTRKQTAQGRELHMRGSSKE